MPNVLGRVLYAVAPHVGAWIETRKTETNTRYTKSLPTWERGLKPSWSDDVAAAILSLPTWERGLKRG